MLINVHLSACLYAAIAAAGMVGLCALYRDYRIDRMRDDLFRLRDELFDYAVAEGLLSHPGYRQLRKTFNGMLRFCHKISFFRICLSMLLEAMLIPSRQRTSAVSQWVASIDDLPDNQKQRLRDFHQRMFIVAMRYMVDTSFFLAPIVIALRIRGAVNHISSKAGSSVFPSLMNKTERGWQIIEEQALQTTR